MKFFPPDQNILNLQAKILHCLTQGTKLAWLIDISRQQIWVWRWETLPLVYQRSDNAPTLDNLLILTVNDVIARPDNVRRGSWAEIRLPVVAP